MVRPFPSQVTDHLQSVPLAIGLFVSIFALVALCAKRGSKSPKRSYEKDLYEVKSSNGSPMEYSKVPKSPLSTPKKLLSNISNLKTNKKNKDDHKDVDLIDEEKDEFAEGGLWQKNILMGEKCQPLEFSGVIYYDNYGNRTSDIPRSPRASTVSLQGSFSFPVSSRSSSDIN